MKRALVFAWLAGMLSCAGCVTSAPHEVMMPMSVTVPVTQSLPPVTPAQITETNGHQVAQALDEEINRDQQQTLLNSKSR